MGRSKLPGFSPSDLARHVGRSPSTITRALQSGKLRETVLKVEGRWRILDLEDAAAELANNTEGRVNRPRKQGPRFGGHDASISPDIPVGQPVSYDKARIRKLQADTRLQELKLQRMRGELVSVEEAAGVFADALSGLRSNLMALADRLALDLMAEDDQHTIRDMLRREFREVLTMASESVDRRRTQEEPEEGQGAQDSNGN